MPFDPEREALLEAAVAKLPKLATIIAAMPIDKQAEALRIAERSYRLTALKLRLGDQGLFWVLAVMDRLRGDTEAKTLATQLRLRALYREVMRISAE